MAESTIVEKTVGRKWRLSLKSKRSQANEKHVQEGNENDVNVGNGSAEKRSCFEVLEEGKLEELAKPFAPKNTQWAMTNFSSWFKWRCECKESSPPEIIWTPECPRELLNRWLPAYVAETRNKEGQKYSPKTLYSLLTGILHFMTTKNPRYPNFLDKSDPDFTEFHRTVDNLFRRLREEGVGADSKQTASISKEEENLLWEKGILNMH